MPKFDDYWFDEYDGRPPYEDGHRGEPHDHPYDDYPHHHHPHPPFDGRRHRPVDMGKVDTTKMHNRYDMFVPYHMPPWGFKFPKLEKAFVPGSTPQEQVAYLLNRVDTMIDYFNHYDDKVWGAYNAVVHSALGNEAYYREITREEGYLADGSTPYTVIHIPYLDRAERPIFLELGLAYNNTTNNGVKENVFEASQNRVADKLIPAFNIADGWEGKAMLKGAPIQSIYTEGKFTLAVTDNGFLKIYPNTVSYDQLNRDRIRNAMGVQGVLINNGAKTPEQYATNGGELLARVGIGMNYETKERLIVIVNGNPTPPNDASVTGATADMLADIFAKYNCTVAVETANNGSAVGMDKGQMIYMPDTATTGVIPTVPSINCYWYITKRRHYHNQYVKDVADLIQKVGQNKWRCEIALQSCDFLKGRVNDLQRDLDAEVQAREDADEQLQNNIDAEAEARRLADEQLQNNINAEAEARRLADEQLQNNIDVEAEARRLADEQLQDNIDAEAEARRLADVQLQDNIDAETNARVAGDNALDERVTNEVSTLNARIDTVIEDFNNAIATERQARIDGDTTLGTRIDNEVATINVRIDNEVSTINARIDTEVATLNALIDAEEQARIAGDTALQNSLTQLREDYTAFLTTYANDLAETRRITSALRSDITTIRGQIAELQSNLSAVNTSITAILATINTIEQSFENIKTAFTELQEDWHDYKDSVDAEIAPLTQDIAELQDVKVQKYDTVAQMKADTALNAGMYARTGGYYAVNDVGGALYRISSTAPSMHYEMLANGLYAEHIYDSEIKPEQFGAYGDGEHDDSSAIQSMIDSVPEHSVCVFLKTYLCNTGILVTRNVNILMYGRCHFPGSLEYAFRVHGYGVKRCKFRLNIACTETAQMVWTSHSIIGLDLWASMENEYDVQIEGFKTGIRLFAGNTNSEVDCTYNKIFIRLIYNCQYAIFLTGGKSGDQMNQGTVAQNTFIGGRIAVQDASYSWLGSENNDDNSYWAVRSVLVLGRTNNNNTFIACSFEGFGVKEYPYANRARVTGEMQAGMYLNCRYEGITGIQVRSGSYDPAMFLGGYCLEDVLPESYPGTSLGRMTQIASYSKPVVIKRSGTEDGDQYLEVRNTSNTILTAFYGNEFFIPRVCLTCDGKPYGSGDTSKAIKLINTYGRAYPVSISEIIEPSECRFSDSGHIMYKNHAGTRIYDIQPIYTSVPTNVLPGTMAFVNGRPRWYDGTNWVYADGTVVT